MTFPLDSQEPQHELCKLRSTLEAFAAARVMAAPGRQQLIQALKLELEAMHQYARVADQTRFHEADLRFHQTLVDAAGMPSLSASWALVAKDLDDWWRLVKMEYWPNLMQLHGEHVILLESLQSPMAWVVEQALHQHLEAGWHRVASMRSSLGQAPDPVARVDAYISTHFASRLDIEFLARHVAFTSASHLTRLFRQRLGISPYARLKIVRLECGAKLLLQSDAEVRGIAAQVGYRSPSHFIRDFRAHFRLTPGQYRDAKSSSVNSSSI